MGDYTQSIDFSDKDALSSGNPAKVIKGADVDTELGLIATAVNSKVDEPSAPSTNDALIWSGSAWIASPLTPVAAVIAYAGSAAPTGWLLCDGSAVSRTTYSDLFAVISTTYGVGDGSTTFNLPDLTGRVVAGKESSASRLTSGGSGVDGATLGAAGGDEALAAHTHGAGSFAAASHTHDIPTIQEGAGASNGYYYTPSLDATDQATAASGALSVSGTSASTGGGSSGNVQPTIILNYIIKT